MKEETRFKEKVLAELRELPYTWAVKIQQTSIRGTPDILACVAGAFVALELKIEGGRLDRLQGYQLKKIGDCLGRAYVVEPGDWLRIKGELGALAADRLVGYMVD